MTDNQTLADLLTNETMPDPANPETQIPTLAWLAGTNPYVGRDVAQIRAALQRLQDEHDARTVPPHLDGCRREGIFHGLVLALHIVTNGAACYEDECWAHERDLLTEIPLIP